MKKIILVLTLLIIIIFSIVTVFAQKVENYDSDKIKITATLFPQYDFAKKIGGDKVEVKLLLPPGVESHSYEPTIQDVLEISKSDLFIYTGDEMEPWASKIADSISKDTIIEDVSKNITFISEEAVEYHDILESSETNFETENLNTQTEQDEHESMNIESNSKHEEHHHEEDPHIWLNPQNAIIMINNVLNRLCEVDSQKKEYYIKNAGEYINKINDLDKEIENFTKENNNKKLVFGGAFAYGYFMDRYNLDYISAYDSCDSGVEPSTQKIKYIIDYMKNNNIKVIFYQDLENGKIAKTIADETGAEMLVFNSIHNISKDKLNSGVTYIDLMEENFENLKKAMEE